MRITIATLLFSLCLSSALAQIKQGEIIQHDKNGSPKLIKFRDTKVPDDLGSINQILRTQFKTPAQSQFTRKGEAKFEHGLKSEKLQQYYKDVKVEFAIFSTVSQEGRLKSINGKYISIDNLDTNPSISEADALQYALSYIGASEYAWQNNDKESIIKRLQKSETATYYPQGELVIIEKNRYSDKPVPTLAYKFDVYATYPMSRKYYYVDANNGEIIFTNTILKHVEGLATTMYSGNRNIETQQTGGQFRLHDTSRGSGVTTFNNFNQTSHTNTDYLDNNNTWTAAEYDNANGDNAGLDAHWGAMMTYDYFSQVHNRNSIDNSGFELINYVNSNLAGWGFVNSDNAFWDGSVMTYGMGTSLDPLVSLDIIAHEIGHGLEDNTSGLIYEREPGAINEGLSDIWGAMVEFHAAPEKDTYIVGEDIGLSFRSMSNPKLRNDPDTYGGTFWLNPDCGTPNNGNDQCGVHTNSGVLNHWFYLLAEGSASTDEINDNSDTFSIAGIGKTKAAKIIFRAQDVYFTPTTDYHDARQLTLQAADDLYGSGSIEVATVCQSWFAVGVGDNNCNFDIELTGIQNLCGNSTTTYTLNYTPNTLSWSTSSKLQILSSNSNSITVKPVSTTTQGLATITVVADGASFTKRIWIGKPHVNTEYVYHNNHVNVSLKGIGATIQEQGLSSNVTWSYTSTGGGGISGSGFQVLAYGPGLTWKVYADIYVSNSCGGQWLEREIAPETPNPNCNNNFNFNGNTIDIEEECDGGGPSPVNGFVGSNRIAKSISLYDLYGRSVISINNSNHLDVSGISSGIYIVKIVTSNDEIITKKIAK